MTKEILGEIAELEGYVKGNISGMEDRYGYYLEYFNDIQELIDNYSKIEKALDSACEIISQFDKRLSDEFGCCYKTKEQWKEYLLGETN